MPRCSGCSCEFPHLDHDLCGKCVKLGSATGPDERGLIFDLPQCKGCSIVYNWLRSQFCAMCSLLEGQATEGPLSGGVRIASTSAHLSGRMHEHQKQASQYWLNQQSQTASIASATEVKRKISMMKKQSCTEELDIDLSLWMTKYSELQNRNTNSTFLRPGVHTSTFPRPRSSYLRFPATSELQRPLGIHVDFHHISSFSTHHHS
ncbi:hypothetical protein PAXRUDRAFT_836521 [Paxillus rubicundulus Ve08.2h10]|uniref:Unplaced genomic scaffold scaffold_6343, whole genome shotgun sequence n=1 Tax=Paxillus rubicundulus Ve08.2h10 TaxID=930991 RepID=A0A0D0CXN0_9AGAM|nr:hypothetical protein PAXRUDRAFT_836521 [Paxillus rubicundulus Ve08.2h10]